MAAARGVDFRQQRRHGLLLAGHGAQHVEAEHIARAFPDAVERRFPVEPGHRPVLDISGAAMAFQRLERMARRALADPVFRNRRADARERPRLPAVFGLVHGAGGPEAERERRLGFQRKVGQHIAHQRLVGEPALEGAAVARVVKGLHDALAHQAAELTAQ